MDVRMPGIDGLAATSALAGTTEARIIILTTFDLDEYVVAAIKAGASGFLLKDAPPEDLLRAIRRVARGRLRHRARRPLVACCERLAATLSEPTDGAAIET